MHAISDKNCIEGILRVKENLDVTDLRESYLGHNKNICNMVNLIANKFEHVLLVQTFIC